MAYTNSPLATVKILSPANNHYGARTHAIDRITPHMVVGQCTATALGNLFANPSRGATSTYGIGYDGQIGLYCEEKNAPGTSSSFANDNRAVTIEIASDTTYPYTIKDAAAKAAINLMADICKRNGKNVLVWKGSKEAALAYSDNGQKSNEMLITFHKWFSSTLCPGAYIENHIQEWVNEVNKILQGSTPTPTPTPTPTVTLFQEAQKMISNGINGQNRINTAKADGFDPAAVQAQIDTMLGKDKTAFMKNMASVMPTVSNGSTGDAVSILQNELKRMGYYSSVVDGICGSVTVAAIKAIQNNWNIVYRGFAVDGSFGPQCWNKLLNG